MGMGYIYIVWIPRYKLKYMYTAKLKSRKSSKNVKSVK